VRRNRGTPHLGYTSHQQGKIDGALDANKAYVGLAAGGSGAILHGCCEDISGGDSVVS